MAKEDPSTVDRPNPKPVVKKSFKLVLRRLPQLITEEELRTQLSPLPAHEAFWVRRAEPFLDDDGFPYAFVAFNVFEEAARFQRTWNGAQLTDSEGNKNAIIVEKSPNQDVITEPPKLMPGVTPITEDIGYLKFIEESQASSNKRVDFDVIVSEIIEREERATKGQWQDTPLTDYILKRHQLKTQRASKTGGTGAASGHKRGGGADAAKASGAGKPEKTRRGEKEKKPKPPKGRKGERVEKGGDEKEKVPKEKPAAESAPAPDAPKNVHPARKEKERREPRPKRPPHAERAKPPPKKPGSDQSKSTPGEKSTNEKSTDKPEKSEKQQKPAVGERKRNKDRPERAIYQPGRGRRYQPKEAASAATAATAPTGGGESAA